MLAEECFRVSLSLGLGKMVSEEDPCCLICLGLQGYNQRNVAGFSAKLLVLGKECPSLFWKMI
jgi:hypothetical protein